MNQSEIQRTVFSYPEKFGIWGDLGTIYEKSLRFKETPKVREINKLLIPVKFK